MRIWTLLLFLSIMHSAEGQTLVPNKPEEYLPIHWDMEDGLPSGMFNVMLKDINGFLWIVTFNIHSFQKDTLLKLMELNAYLTTESKKRDYLTGAKFIAGVHEYYPIPDKAIITSYKDGKPTLKQNPG